MTIQSNRYYLDVEQTDDGCSASVSVGGEVLAKWHSADVNSRRMALYNVLHYAKTLILDREAPPPTPKEAPPTAQAEPTA